MRGETEEYLNFILEIEIILSHTYDFLKEEFDHTSNKMKSAEMNFNLLSFMNIHVTLRNLYKNDEILK